MVRVVLLVALMATPSCALAQRANGQHEQMQHGQHASGMIHAGEHGTAAPDGIREVGQSAFAAIQEIVAQLMADPQTDWSRVNIEALRQHLIDMDNVTLRAQVIVEEVEGGAHFKVTSGDAAVTTSIRTMVQAHAATMNGYEGWEMQSEEIPGGAALTVTGADPVRIRALGFIGVMTVGMHHQTHHFSLAIGQDPHKH